MKKFNKFPRKLHPSRGPKCFHIPAGTMSKPCRYCGAPVYWVVSEAGKNVPVDADGFAHNRDCKGPGR